MEYTTTITCKVSVTHTVLASMLSGVCGRRSTCPILHVATGGKYDIKTLPSYTHLLPSLGNAASRHFAEDPLNRDAGELLWKELLVHGGARDPHVMLRALLGEAGGGGEEGLRAGVQSLLEDMMEAKSVSSSSNGSGTGSTSTSQ